MRSMTGSLPCAVFRAREASVELKSARNFDLTLQLQIFVRFSQRTREPDDHPAPAGARSMAE
jgi:hypothetical protein